MLSENKRKQPIGDCQLKKFKNRKGKKNAISFALFVPQTQSSVLKLNMQLNLLFLLTTFVFSNFSGSQALNWTINGTFSGVHENKSILQCPRGENCSLKCISDFSCSNYEFICISNSTTCSIECQGLKSCAQMHATIDNSNYFYFYSSGEDASDTISLIISNTLQVILSIPSSEGHRPTKSYSLSASTVVVTSVTVFSAYVRIFFCSELPTVPPR